jgi:PilZ domain-containing protein
MRDFAADVAPLFSASSARLTRNFYVPRVRRRHRRFEVFEPAGGSAGPIEDTAFLIRNASRSGLFLEASAYAVRSLWVGDDVELLIRDGAIRLYARIVHVSLRGIGVRIVSVDPASAERYEQLLADYAASSAAMRCRARARRDMTVPMGVPARSAASR